jgi:Cu-Zn family superoxide dismutase
MKAVAVFRTRKVKGEAVGFSHPTRKNAMRLRVTFSRIPKGLHGFHIHKGGDLRGEGCKGACDHYHVGTPKKHGGPPTRKNRQRHTGDLGNIQGPRFTRTYTISHVSPQDLWGRSLIVHADPDDLGMGPHPDSEITGHSGKRIACAIFGRVECEK